MKRKKRFLPWILIKLVGVNRWDWCDFMSHHDLWSKRVAKNHVIWPLTWEMITKMNALKKKKALRNPLVAHHKLRKVNRVYGKFDVDISINFCIFFFQACLSTFTLIDRLTFYSDFVYVCLVRYLFLSLCVCFCSWEREKFFHIFFFFICKRSTSPHLYSEQNETQRRHEETTTLRSRLLQKAHAMRYRI